LSHAERAQDGRARRSGPPSPHPLSTSYSPPARRAGVVALPACPSAGQTCASGRPRDRRRRSWSRRPVRRHDRGRWASTGGSSVAGSGSRERLAECTAGSPSGCSTHCSAPACWRWRCSPSSGPRPAGTDRVFTSTSRSPGSPILPRCGRWPCAPGRSGAAGCSSSRCRCGSRSSPTRPTWSPTSSTSGGWRWTPGCRSASSRRSRCAGCTWRSRRSIWCTRWSAAPSGCSPAGWSCGRRSW